MAVLWLSVLAVSLTWTQAAAKEKCMGELGCFENSGDFFHLLRRPLWLLPDDREVINTTFLLYTAQNPKAPMYLNSQKKQSVTDSTFKINRPTKFIIHGFMDNQYFGKWMVEMKDELLDHGDYNVVIVDWAGGNGFPYGQATVNSRVVGAELGLLISKLLEWVNLDLSKVHLIGHSLGSHIAGYAGKRVANIERITGLDPAEPYFQGLPTTVRLDREDAKFVDAIHTDSSSIFFGGFGMSDPVGHLDFFPNEGKSQPGCNSERITSWITDGLGEGLRRFVACNHQRAIDFFTDSISNDDCNFVGYECNSWKRYLAAECTECGSDGSKCAYMGIRADEFAPKKKDGQSIVMYLSTKDKASYCYYQYRVVVYLDKGNGKYSDQKGTFSVFIAGAYDSLEAVLGDDTFKHGSEYTFVINSATELGPLNQLKFTFKAGINIFKTQEVYLEKIVVEPMHYTDKNSKNQMGQTFCYKIGEAIPKNKETTLTVC